MPHRSTPPLRLSPCDIGSCFSYDLSGEHIVARLFGLFPVLQIHLGAVLYLRLASRTETSPVFQLFNWIDFMPHRRSVRPVYILQTRSGHRITLKMDSSTHFKLRQAIGRHAVRSTRLAA